VLSDELEDHLVDLLRVAAGGEVLAALDDLDACVGGVDAELGTSLGDCDGEDRVLGTVGDLRKRHRGIEHRHILKRNVIISYEDRALDLGQLLFQVITARDANLNESARN
jgi:hypothetical protein